MKNFQIEQKNVNAIISRWHRSSFDNIFIQNPRRLDNFKLIFQRYIYSHENIISIILKNKHFQRFSNFVITINRHPTGKLQYRKSHVIQNNNGNVWEFSPAGKKEAGVHKSRTCCFIWLCLDAPEEHRTTTHHTRNAQWRFYLCLVTFEKLKRE